MFLTSFLCESNFSLSKVAAKKEIKFFRLLLLVADKSTDAQTTAELFILLFCADLSKNYRCLAFQPFNCY